jgi:hypothetical protein
MQGVKAEESLEDKGVHIAADLAYNSRLFTVDRLNGSIDTRTEPFLVPQTVGNIKTHLD